MDKDTRNAIERATQQARKLLEDDFASQLEGSFDVLRAGTVAPKAGSHLSLRQVFQRDKIVAAIEHKRAAGMTAADAGADYLRDAAFTTLNRFVALKMLEARDLVQECITKGEESAGYREFCGLAPGVALLPDSTGYRLYLECLFDELSTEVKVLFDRRDSASVLWPKRATFEALLDVLNGTELAGVWGEDETIGWVYQYFNSADERREMREESQAPRNSRELAVRNQFFTPRYVVQFLVDNTLAHIWHDMRHGETSLHDKCQYLVRDAKAPLAERQKKDPRDIRVLDPACGSGHFLLYAFDILVTIYEEAYSDTASPASQVSGATLANDYPTADALRRALPGLILAHNLHGVDIDPRCAQIAQLALWIRAQRAFKELLVSRVDRPRLRRANIVVAEPMPGEDDLQREVCGHLEDKAARDHFIALQDHLHGAGHLGVLLQAEHLLTGAVRRGETGQLFNPPHVQIRALLSAFARSPQVTERARRRLFADDALQGLGLLGLCEKRFDVIVMNPPFGLGGADAEAYCERQYPSSKRELACAFVERSMDLLDTGGLLGVIATRMPLFIKTYAEWRDRVLMKGRRIQVLVDLGRGVLDATVESAAYVLGQSPTTATQRFFKAMSGGMVFDDAPERLRDAVKGSDSLQSFSPPPDSYNAIPNWPIAYWLRADLADAYRKFRPFESEGRKASSGASTNDDFRFLRLWCEVTERSIGIARDQTQNGQGWVAIAKGGEYSPYYRNVELVVNWRDDGAECKAFISDYRGKKGWGFHWAAALNGYIDYFRPGVTWSRRTSTWISGRALPAGCIFGDKGPAAFLGGDDSRALTGVLAWMNSSVAGALIELSVGKEGSQGTAMSNSYEVGIIERLPYPGESALESSRGLALEALLVRQQRTRSDELNRLFSGPARGDDDGAAGAARALVLQREIDAAVGSALGLSADTVRELEETSRVGALQAEAPYEEVFRPRNDTAFAHLQFAVGCAFHRWDVKALDRASAPADPFDALPEIPPAALAPEKRVAVPILVEDSGHPLDIVKCCLEAVECHRDSLTLPDDPRDFIKHSLFSEHLTYYSRSRRRAPIYWQLGTPQATYSVWLYVHSFTSDTLYKAQNDFVGPKLAHEERKLESLRRDLGERPKATERKVLAQQETLVDDLRAFLDEVKRVSALWHPNLDDGVVINFAPFWRLVPQHKPWQKELKATWDALCEGTYDWAHLAVHLWPERVIPKCAKDRSLAIAHGLGDVFWVEGSDGKWTARKTPTRSVDELVRERTSPAVKAALKSLLEAPIVQGGAGRGRGGRRTAASADEGGSR